MLKLWSSEGKCAKQLRFVKKKHAGLQFCIFGLQLRASAKEAPECWKGSVGADGRGSGKGEDGEEEGVQKPFWKATNEFKGLLTGSEDGRGK